MMARSTVPILAMAAMAAWGPAGSRAGEGDTTRAGAVVGRVVDGQGRPVAGAELWAIAFRDEVGRVKADLDGRFRLGPIAEARTLTIWASGAGLARERWEDIRVFAGKDRDLGTLTLVPGTRFAGRAVDARGIAVAGARVSVEVYHRVLGHSIDSDQKTWELATDALGRFGTDPLPAGEVSLSITAPGKVMTQGGRKLTPGKPETFAYPRAVPGIAVEDLGDVKLDDEVPIRGLVVDQDGKPAPGVEIIPDYEYKIAATTDAGGRFTIGGAGGAAKELRVQSNDYFAPKPFPIGEKRDEVRLVVRRAYTILGSAVDAETGGPVKIETVRLCMVTHEPDGTTSLRG